MALRLSIGAGRGRLIQQMLVESALVAGAACALGLLFAEVAGPAVVGMLASADDPVHLDLRLDWRLAAFAGGVALLTTALFGLVPALRASSVAPITALKTGGGRSGVRAGVMRPFVAAQVAFGLVVLFVGSLLVLSFARLSSVNPGFATSDVLLLSLEAVAARGSASSSARHCSRCSTASATFPGCRPSAPPSPTCSVARGPTTSVCQGRRTRRSKRP